MYAKNLYVELDVEKVIILKTIKEAGLSPPMGRIFYSANNSSIFLIKFLEGTVIVSISSSVMA